MAKKGRIYIIIAVVTLGLLMLLQYNQPKEVNWFPSYVAQHKIPYGTIVLNDIMENRFPDMRQISIAPYEFLNSEPDANGTYFFVNEQIEFDPSERDKLLEWTANGNTLFLASESFDKTFLDTLGLKTTGLYDALLEDKGQLHQLVHPKLRKETGFLIKKDAYTQYFSEIDTLQSTVLGIVDHFNADGKIATDHVNVLSKPFGDGTIILSTFPKAFTNYFILKDGNRDYTAGLLSYLDRDTTIYMDNHYKSGKAFYTSPLYIFLNNKALKWAYYLVLIGVVVYVLFEGKRKQRAIPIVRPLQNQTLAFTRTIADMYFEKKEAKEIAEHKIDYFLEYIRSRFYLGTINRESEFYRNLASRSAHSIEEVEQLFHFLDTIRNQQMVTDGQLIRLNTSIEQFKTRADGRK
ncbi:DUF4350 domain-containing protein [Aggregatimonas sangjinii]|uniref:DUF4350 domain-containing protein n=1 Tax=Aggregatimonas sangjinii TaxID=2583587 RepID=A0A5B7SQU7_9FLAO|nr:DUF4350 domain-containing protein [Aggregatimonas sangjinii]QCW99319.1 DUF4350 domain-containing protein [Aggregatimonas sangjinii]